VPTLKLRRALEALLPGQTVLLVADDPMARIDVPHFAQEAGHALAEIFEDAGALSFLITKGASAAPGD